MGMPIRLQGWSAKAIDKARMYELITSFAGLAATHTPDLMRYVAPCIKRLQPVRLSPGGRSLRAWGRDYRFNAEDSRYIEKLVKAYHNGVRCIELRLPASTSRQDSQDDYPLKGHPALKDGVIQRNGATYWLEEPAEEKAKPKLVLFVDAEPEEVLSKKYRALAILAEHPDWSDTRIAAEVPCGRQTLYTWPEFVQAKNLTRKEGRAKYQRDSVNDPTDDFDNDSE